MLTRDSHQAERVIEFAICKSSSIGDNAGTVELQLEVAVEIEPQSIGLRFTRWLNHLRHRTDQTKR
ncbi:MAG: hypothetical protein KIT36_14505 [Alphaproteobacteria bacterium]|nr:hypothetical protein [Alphaproteobacteria bacterium]